MNSFELIYVHFLISQQKVAYYLQEMMCDGLTRVSGREQYQLLIRYNFKSLYQLTKNIECLSPYKYWLHMLRFEEKSTYQYVSVQLNCKFYFSGIFYFFLILLYHLGSDQSFCDRYISYPSHK